MAKSISERRGDVFYDVHGILTAHNSTVPHPLFMALVEFIAIEAHTMYAEGEKEGYSNGWHECGATALNTMPKPWTVGQLARIAGGDSVIRGYLMDGKKITAIKELRSLTNCSLREAKDGIEAEFASADYPKTVATVDVETSSITFYGTEVPAQTYNVLDETDAL